MSDELRLFKLFTSEEVVVKVIDEKEDYFLVNKPRLCALRQEHDEQGNITGNFLVLMPWMVYATDPETGTEQDIKLYKNVIAGEADKMPGAIEKEWLHVTSTIQLLS